MLPEADTYELRKLMSNFVDGDYPDSEESSGTFSSGDISKW